MNGGFLPDVVLRDGLVILKQFASVGKILSVDRGALSGFDLDFQVFNSVVAVDVKGKGFLCHCVDVDFHVVLRVHFKLFYILFSEFAFKVLCRDHVTNNYKERQFNQRTSISYIYL